MYRPKYKKKRTSRLPRSASVRVHVKVRNGYGRARGVGAAPRRWRPNEAIRPKISVPRIADAKQNKRFDENSSSEKRRRHAIQTLESMPPLNSKHHNSNNYRLEIMPIL